MAKLVLFCLLGMKPISRRYGETCFVLLFNWEERILRRPLKFDYYFQHFETLLYFNVLRMSA